MDISVLVVGAGPTGLFAACELSRHGVPVRIIDKKATPTQTSNALGIQPRTMEIFNLTGIVDRFLKAGQRATALKMFRNGKNIITITMDTIDSPYHYIFLLPQNITEKILTERLTEYGVSIERSTELTSLKKKSNKTVAVIKHPNGHLEEVSCSWVIGCDGLHSVVRQNTNIDFEGDDITEPFALADASLKSNLPSDTVSVFFSKKNVAAFFPIEGNRYRIMGNLDKHFDLKSLDDKFFSHMIEDRSYGTYHLTSVNWSSHFWIHSKSVNVMHEGAIFIAGDAAHVHSPVGGQGMNTGLQDVFNLCWKLAAVHKGLAKPLLLDSYNAERLPVIKGIVAFTDQMTRTMLSSNPLVSLMRSILIKVVASTSHLRKFISQRIAQIMIRYTNSHVIENKRFMSATSPKPGERAPDVNFNQKNLYDYFRHTKHSLLIFMGKESDTYLLSLLRKQIIGLQVAYKESIAIHIVSEKNLENVPGLLLDPKRELHQRYRVRYPGFYLIRPDNVIAFCQNRLDFKALHAFLNLYLVPNSQLTPC